MGKCDCLGRLMQEYPETDWYLWIDSDTMIINPTFNLPLHKFAGKDLVIWGNETALLAGDGRSGARSPLAAAWMWTCAALQTFLLCGRTQRVCSRPLSL